MQFDKNKFEINGTTLVKYIGDEEEVVVPEGVTEIAATAFVSAKVKKIVLPDSVERIEDCTKEGKSPFMYSAVQEISLDNGLKHIGVGAFSQAKNLTEILIPASVTSIGEGALLDCDKLKSVRVAEGNPVYYDDGDCIIQRNTKTLVAGCPVSVVPDGVQTILAYAMSCLSGQAVYFPDSVKKLGENCATWCSVKKLTLGKNICFIPEQCFGYSNIEEVYLGENVSVIGEKAFYHGSIKNLYLPEGLTEIGEGAFESCYNLECVVLPESLTLLGSGAFAKCAHLNTVRIGSKITAINARTFAHTDLKDVVLPVGLTKLCEGAFEGCKGLHCVVLPQSLQNIGAAVFKGCESLSVIKYLGTAAQWKAIMKEKGWDDAAGDYIVCCKNGIIKKTN